MKTKKTTNITSAHKHAFEALTSERFENFALFSCFVNGAPASCIVAVTREGARFTMTPLFVSVTADMVLTDHDGVAA